MNHDLSFQAMLAIYILATVPLLLSVWAKLGILKETIIAFTRMSVQLGLVGIYLHVLFDKNSLLLNATWMLIMLLVANHAILDQAHLRKRPLFATTFVAIFLSAVGVTILFVVGIIQPTPIFDARYLIPLFGMILGNSMRANILALERFYHSIRTREEEFITYLTLGGTVAEASRPFLIEALRATVRPYIATMTTMGIVSLPGMMTGQLLGGASPNAAIRYQIAIMICIFTTLMIGTVFNLAFSRRVAFDDYGMLRQDIFQK